VTGFNGEDKENRGAEEVHGCLFIPSCDQTHALNATKKLYYSYDMSTPLPQCLVPIYPPGKEPLPPGLTEADRPQLLQAKKWESYMAMGMESCVTKTILAGGAGAFVDFLWVFSLGRPFSVTS
jgi:hypothetical protein